MIESLAPEAIVSEWVSAFNGADVSRLRELCAPDLIVHANSPADGVSGLDAVAISLRIYRSACPDARFAIEEIYTDRGRLACRWIGRGTNTAPFLHFVPTNREVIVRGVCQFRFVDQRIVEHWFDYDLYAVYEQLDALLPAPGQGHLVSMAISEAAVNSWLAALTAEGPLATTLFSDSVLVHSACFQRKSEERGRAALADLIGVFQARLEQIRVSIEDRVSQGRTSTYRAQISARASGATETMLFRFYCMCRTRDAAIEEIWFRLWRTS